MAERGVEMQVPAHLVPAVAKLLEIDSTAKTERLFGMKALELHYKDGGLDELCLSQYHKGLLRRK